MAQKIRLGLSSGGPDGAGGWYDNGENIIIPGATATTVPVLTPAGILPQYQRAAVSSAGASVDTLPAGTPIMRGYGAQVAFLAALVAQATLNLLISYYRANVQLGGGPAFGWQAGLAGTPAFAALTSVVLPALPANTALVVNGAESYVPLQPGDIEIVTVSTSAGTVVVPTAIVQLGVI